MKKILLMLGAALLLLSLALVLTDRFAGRAAAPGPSGSVRVENAWIRAVPRAGGNTAAYAILTNTGSSPDRLLEARSDSAARVELHTHVMDAGVARMRRVEAIELPEGKSVELRPGGLHIMFLDLTRPLNAGDKVELRLFFEKAGEIKLVVPVAAAALASNNH